MSMITSITSGPRNSGMELLRITAMFLVLVVHADYVALGVPEDVMNANTICRVAIEALGLVCVNCFVLISGWFGIRASIKGFCNFMFQCVYFMGGIWVVRLITGGEGSILDIFGKVQCLYPHISAYISSPLFSTLSLSNPQLNV